MRLHTISGSKEEKRKRQKQELHQREGSNKKEAEKQERQGCKQELHPERMSLYHRGQGRYKEEPAGPGKLRRETESRQLLPEKRELRRALRTCRVGERAEREEK